MESRGRGWRQQAVGRDFCHLVLVAPVLLVGTAGEQRGSAKQGRWDQTKWSRSKRGEGDVPAGVAASFRLSSGGSFKVSP